MSQSRSRPSTDESAALTSELSALRRWLAFPSTPNLIEPVGARISGRRPATGRALPQSRWLWAAAAILLLAAIASIATPGVRGAIADALGVSGIHITFSDDAEPTVTPNPDTLSAELGTRSTLDDAAQQVSFPLNLPDSKLIGEPSSVFVRTLSDGTKVVSLLYEPTEDLPEAAETGAGALLMIFRGEQDDIYFEKRVRSGGQVTETRVHDYMAFWIEGTSELVMLDELSTICCGPLGRPTANVLIWSAEGVTYRLETALSFADAWIIAESIDPGAATVTSEP